MKNIYKFLFFFFLQILFLTNVNAQTSNFNLEAYKQFLQTHQDMSTQALLQLYDAGKFAGNINQDYNSAVYFDSIDIKYKLTDYEKSLLQQNGFVVSERLSSNSYGTALNDVYSKDLPVYISTDAILHALHMSYDNILKDVELSVLIDSVKSMLTQMHEGIPALAANYPNNPAMAQSLADADFYLTVPLDLLGQQATPIYSINEAKISEVMTKIMAADGMGEDTLFSAMPVTYDWSQFKPRGHYADEQHPILANYFRAMIWLGRMEIYLLLPRAQILVDSIAAYKSLQRQTIAAMLIRELYDAAKVNGTYNTIENILKFFIGDQDNVTIDNLAYMKNAVNISKASDLLDSLKLMTFQDTLRNQSFASQAILSQILIHDPFKPDSIIPASSFLLFGQRFIIDSYVTSNVVYDRTKSCRLLPSSLDPMFALGNSAAGQLLQDEISNYDYGANLAALRYLIDSYGTDFWQQSFYNLWLNSIRALNPPTDRSSLPAFMKTAGFWQEKLNTQLASWAELRHDNLLYAKQSYSAGNTCSFPYTYIEPFTLFYSNLKALAETAANDFSKLNISNSGFMQNVIYYFNNLGQIADTLYTITTKELNSTPFTRDEINFLQHTFSPPFDACGGPSVSFLGWYNTLYYEIQDVNVYKNDYIVADIHTAPIDCMGNPLGWIKHVGTGQVNLGVFMAPLPNNQMTAFVGPVSSYYEYTSTNFLRLTDQEWQDSALSSALRPSWVNGYLADNKGASRGPGASLITGIKNGGGQQNFPDTYLTVKAYPNPFNPSTILSINIPEKYSNSLVQLSIYDIQGRLIKRIINKNLSSGDYLYKWDGKNENGLSVSSGVYITNLRVEDRMISTKIMLLK